jgi:hypothetical protein
MTLQPTSSGRRSALAGAVLLIAPAVSGAQAACLTVNPDQPPPALPDGWCVTAALAPSQQTPFDWSTESLALSTLTFETLPGQLGNLSLVGRPDGLEIWKGTVAGNGVAKSRPLLLVPGDYGITITAGPTALVYRAEITEPAPLPAELPPAVAGAFEGLLHGTGAEIVVPWTVAQADQAGLWTLEVQAPIGATMTATLRDSTGNIVVYTGIADSAGTFRLPDLDLTPGAYTLSVSAPPAGMPLIAAARLEPRAAGFATEPDDVPAQAHPLEPERPAMGRLASGGTGRESDHFALTVPPGEPRMYDVTLSAPSGLPLNLALTDDTGRNRAQRDGIGTVALNSLVLPSGRHLLKVTGMLPPEETYTLLARQIGVPTAGQETEPNNEAIDANQVPASGIMTGTFEGTDSEYLVLAVTGRLQLWDIEATGEGAYRLGLYDAAQRLIAATSVRAGAVLRLDRMLLPPGANIVLLEGTDGSWLLRAKPAGDVVEGEEYESNDEAARALVLPFGEPQTGWLQRADDRDMYAFHLAAWQRVAIAVTGPSGVPVRMSLSWGEASNRIAEAVGSAAARGEAGLVWQGLLPPGDFLVDLRPAEGRSREPYTILLESPSFFDRPLDLEPNDEIWQVASRPPAGNIIEGFDAGDTDWFPLGSLETAGPLVVKADQLPAAVELRVAYGDPRAPQMGEVFYLYQSGETAQFNPPAEVPLYLGVRGSTGPYKLSLGPAQMPPTLPIEAELSFEPARVAAFEEIAQRLSGTLVIRSEATTPLQIGTRAWISDERWRLEHLPELLEVPASGNIEVPVSLEVPADASDQAPVFVDLELRQGDAVPTLVRAVVEVRADAPAVGAHAYEAMPAPLRGGLNLASLVLGASSDGPAAGLFDGVVDVAGVTLELNQPATVTLAANAEPVPIAGVILQPARGGSPSDRLSDFAVEASTDGVAFERVLEATLSPAPREQSFALAEPVDARALRLVPLAAAGGPDVLRARLAELQAIAPPGFVLDPAGLDIADPALGGHIVRVFGLGDQTLTGEGAIWPGSYPVYISLPAQSAEPLGWVFGFRDGRAAQLSTIVWHPRQDVLPEEQIRRVAVAASTVGPLGPWTDVGTFDFGEGAGPEPLGLPAPLWARALRFTVLDPLSGRLALPERIEIRETPGLSILGAWPDLSPRGPFESAEAGAPVAAATAGISHDAGLPTELALDTLTRGEVRRGLVEDWYAIELPEQTRAVTARFDDGVAPTVALTLVAADGAETPFDRDLADPATLVAAAGPGKWRIRVTQPVASIAVTWDTSGSVGALVPAIERMIRRLGWELDAEREAMNLLPFQGEASAFLMPQWSGDRASALSALLAYPFSDSSSEAESAMLVAARELSARAGQRAIVLVTDASFSDTSKNEQLWRHLAAGQVKVFSLYLPVDYDPARTRAQIDLMSDWASAAGGHLSRFASQADSETAYRRVAAWLNRPANYAFAVSAETSPPPPGLLRVELGAAEDNAIAGRVVEASLAVSVILDASGSMLQRIGSERRIDIAKRVLRELGENVLPEGLPISLRVFGHDEPGSCESELFLPLMPLDRGTLTAALDRVQSVNLARTSIAASLRATSGDLAGAGGSRIVVLITDGEETCGGDPLAEITRLREEGVDVRLNIVGFAIDDSALRETFEAWASAGAGEYFDAGDSEALEAAVRGATALSYSILDESGAELGTGVVGETIELPPGRYIIRFGGEIADVEVTLRPGATESLVVGPPGLGRSESKR